MVPEAPFEAEEFWEDLLAFTEEGRVLPVVGPEVLTIERAAANRFRCIEPLPKHSSPGTACPSTAWRSGTTTS